MTVTCCEFCGLPQFLLVSGDSKCRRYHASFGFSIFKLVLCGDGSDAEFSRAMVAQSEPFLKLLHARPPP